MILHVFKNKTYTNVKAFIHLNEVKVTPKWPEVKAKSILFFDRENKVRGIRVGRLKHDAAGRI